MSSSDPKNVLGLWVHFLRLLDHLTLGVLFSSSTLLILFIIVGHFYIYLDERGTVMNRSLKPILFLVFGAVLFTVPAQAAVRLGLFWAPTYNIPESGAAGGLGVAGGGMTLAIYPKSKVGIEIGALYQSENQYGSLNQNLAVPLILRFQLARLLSFGAGGYLDYQLTNVTSNVNALNYGIRAIIGFDIPLGKSVTLATDFGFRYGLVSALRNSTVSYNQVVALVGFRFGAVKGK